MNDKYIFLDIDGVLSNYDYSDMLCSQWTLREDLFHKPFYDNNDWLKMKDGIYKDKYGVLFDPRCLGWLDLIIKTTGAKIILSSDWRKAGLKKMQQMWTDRNIAGELINCTPILKGLNRTDEIKTFIEKHSIQKYCIIDDTFIQLENFIQTNYYKGLDHKTSLNVISILNNKPLKYKTQYYEKEYFYPVNR